MRRGPAATRGGAGHAGIAFVACVTTSVRVPFSKIVGVGHEGISSRIVFQTSAALVPSARDSSDSLLPAMSRRTAK